MNLGGLVFDEYGRPFVILKEQQAKSRLRGKDAQKVSRVGCESFVTVNVRGSLAGTCSIYFW